MVVILTPIVLMVVGIPRFLLLQGMVQVGQFCGRLCTLKMSNLTIPGMC